MPPKKSVKKPVANPFPFTVVDPADMVPGNTYYAQTTEKINLKMTVDEAGGNVITKISGTFVALINARGVYFKNTLTRANLDRFFAVFKEVVIHDNIHKNGEPYPFTDLFYPIYNSAADKTDFLKAANDYKTNEDTFFASDFFSNADEANYNYVISPAIKAFYDKNSKDHSERIVLVPLNKFKFGAGTFDDTNANLDALMESDLGKLIDEEVFNYILKPLYKVETNLLGAINFNKFPNAVKPASHV